MLDFEDFLHFIKSQDYYANQIHHIEHIPAQIAQFGDLDKVLIADTLCCETGNNLEVISLIDLFGEAVYRTIVGESLSSLFS